MGKHEHLNHATAPEIERFFSDGQPLELQHHYFDWLLHLRNNQMATLGGEALGGVSNAVFDIINEYRSVVSGIQVRLTKFEAEPPIWPKLLIRSQQVAMSAFHLAVGCLLQESGALMRVSVELFAHARYLEKNPYLEMVWRKREDPLTAKIYKKKFKDENAKVLYAGVPDVHQHFRFWSELGSHSNVRALRLHDAPNPLEVSAQTDNLEVINEILLHLLSTCLLMADLAKAYVQAPPGERKMSGRQQRLAFYQTRLKRLNWDPKDHPLFDSSL